jgi:hypothetical protein
LAFRAEPKRVNASHVFHLTTLSVDSHPCIPCIILSWLNIRGS